MAKKKATKKTARRSKAKKKATKAPAKTTAAKTKSGGNMGLAIVALILNILILPGLGSLIGGKTKEGIWQLVLAIVGIVLSIIIIGIPIIIAAWVWGIVTGVRLVQEAQ